MNDTDRLQIEVDLKKLQYSITKAKANKEEVEVKLLESKLNVARLKEQSEAQDKLIQDFQEKILTLEEKLNAK